jgi:hypothetical protein
VADRGRSEHARRGRAPHRPAPGRARGARLTNPRRGQWPAPRRHRGVPPARGAQRVLTRHTAVPRVANT